jgi:hypothetical protein
MDCTVCKEHSGHAARIKNLEDEGKKMENSNTAAHRRIDGMKNWVIAGMTSLVMQLLLMIAGLALYWIKSKTGAS